MQLTKECVSARLTFYENLLIGEENMTVISVNWCWYYDKLETI